MDKIKLLAEYQIHSLEQPIKPKQYDALHQIIKGSPIPIALDEELIGIYDYKEKCNLIASLQPHYLVLKPSLHGGLMGCEEWIFIAQTNKINWWVTSALESNIGLNAIAQWCSRYERCYEMAQGLGTGNLYENNFPTHLTLVDYLLYIQK
jgi:O-succinylbenzoate synthase